eukprot:m.212248 g.212248  ORF g.212248 m.212248 type:complete len:269 (+) comp33120_c10_seq1:122-928(+)
MSYGRGGGDGDNQYLQRSQKIASSIFQINKNVTEIGKYVSHLGTARDHEDMRKRMHQIQEQTRNVARDTGQALKQLSHMDGGSGSEGNSRRMQQEKLGRDFKAVLQKFQSQSQVALSKERETAGRIPKKNNSGGDSSGSQKYDERTSLIENQQRAQQQHLDNQIDYSSSIIADRDESIKQIEETMSEVNEIYRDLSTLVVEQGSQLDNIEANMSSADSSVDTGVEQLGIASRYQKKSRNKLCCMLIVVAIVLAVIVIIVVTETAGKKK